MALIPASSILLLPFGRQLQRIPHIASLRGLVAADEQDDRDAPTLRIIDAIARTVIDPHLAHAFADGLHIARIAFGQTVDPDEYLRDGARVAQLFQPALETRR